MKLLFDEHLSPKLPAMLEDAYPGSMSVFNVGLGGSPDRDLLRHASEQQFIVVSKDRDFLDMILQSNSKTKLIWIRLGNSSTAAIHLLLRNQAERISKFSQSDDLVLELP